MYVGGCWVIRVVHFKHEDALNAYFAYFGYYCHFQWLRGDFFVCILCLSTFTPLGIRFTLITLSTCDKTFVSHIDPSVTGGWMQQLKDKIFVLKLPVFCTAASLLIRVFRVCSETLNASMSVMYVSIHLEHRLIFLLCVLSGKPWAQIVNPQCWDGISRTAKVKEGEFGAEGEFEAVEDGGRGRRTKRSGSE